jgi:3-oxoacyl-[acyl-carrier-protein] synthase-3
MQFNRVFITGTGAFFPGAPVDNFAIDRYIAPINALSSRIKRRILAENGIQTRHYALDESGASTYSCAGMAAAAVRACVGDDPGALRDIGLLAAATSTGDLMLPGFANMLQAELGAPAMATASHHGVCASGMTALQHAALALEHGAYDSAIVAAAEFPSRLFKRSRFSPGGYNADFDAHFLRWMLSDAAGAWRLSTQASSAATPALRLDNLHLRSFSGELPLCMQAGLSSDGRHWGDFETFTAADEAGAMLLRQDIRLLPQLFDVATHEYVALVQKGAFDPSAIDHFLCHYSSERFAPMVRRCLELAQLEIDPRKWYSNLRFRGNTGAASIFTMLDDFLRERRPRVGEKVLLFVPESGRFTVAFAVLTVVSCASQWEAGLPIHRSEGALPSDAGRERAPPSPMPEAPHSADSTQAPELARLLRELALVWHDYRSALWRTPLVRRILDGSISKDDYLRWMEQWIPQVREGSGWMLNAAAGLTSPYADLRSEIEKHAADEQRDFRILFDDYRTAGGVVDSVDLLKRNPGGDALHAYLKSRSEQSDALGLLGAMYIIEGTGQRVIPALLPLLRRHIGWLGRSFRFLAYHGSNDVAHLQRWLSVVEAALAVGGQRVADEIIEDARHTAVLYARQMEMIR